MVIRIFLLRALSVVLVIATPSVTPVYAQKKRQRIALRGQISRNAVGIPKWASDRSKNNYGEPGDSILLRSESRPGEQITIGAYLYCQNIRKESDGTFVNTSDWYSAPVSKLGAQWGYRSDMLRSVGIWTRITNATQNNTDYNIQLFLPYGAIGLQNATYRFRYRIRVWTDNALVDDFYTDENRIAVVSPSDKYRELMSICAAVVGPSSCSFRLVGTDDPLESGLEPTPQ